MANMHTPWTQYMEPFKIMGNLYFVGCYAASSHLINTSEGIILIDTGYPQNLYMLIDSIYKLGFSPYDIKFIIHSHGHYDHLGGTRALAELTGAKTFIGSGDVDYANGKLDLTWAVELGYGAYYEAFEPDVIMNDGDKIRLGETEFLKRYNLFLIADISLLQGLISLWKGRLIYLSEIMHGTTTLKKKQNELLTVIRWHL